MKRCPTCDKTFDDAMRFCQVDGTPLVEAAEPIDPYKTMVARPEDIAAAIPPLVTPVETSAPKEEDEEVLQIPEAEADPKKTMYASEAEIRSAMDDVDQPEEPVMDIPPYSEPVPPEPPKFTEPSLSPPSFGDTGGPPPTPFSPDVPSEPSFSKTPPIPSPFDQSAPASFDPPAPSFDEPKPEPPVFAEPEPVSPAFNPFNEPAAAEVNAPLAQAEWTPPAAQESDWQDQNNMQNPQFQSGGPAAAGQSQVLAIVSLVVGILSLLCCAWFVPGIVAIVLGFLARSKANSDPASYGGAGLALGGIITGAISLVLGVIVVILYFLGFAASMMQGM
jgi:hypothetical protein